MPLIPIITQVVPPSPSGSVRRSIAVDTDPSHYAIREMGSHAHLEYMQVSLSLFLSSIPFNFPTQTPIYFLC